MDVSQKAFEEMMKKYFLISLLLFSTCVSAQVKVLSLQQTLELARQNNPFLKVSALNIDASQADVETAKLRPNPMLNNQTLQSVNSSYFADGTGTFNHRNRQVWWQLTTPVPMKGQLKYRIERAERGMVLQQKNQVEAERGLLYQAANLWVDIWNQQRNLAIFQKAQEYIDTLVNINVLRLKNQVITQTDLLRTQTLSGQYKIQYATAQQQYQTNLQGLKLILGVSDSLGIDPNDGLDFVLPLVADSISKYAQNTRSDVQIAQQSIAVAESNVKLQNALKTPRPELGFIWNPQNGSNYFGFFGTVPLPFYDRNQGEIQKSKVLKIQSEKQLEATKRFALMETQTALQRNRSLKTNVEKFGQVLKQSDLILENVRYSYLRGATTIIDFLEAQRSWLDVQQQYQAAQYAYRLSLIDLLYVSGKINDK